MQCQFVFVTYYLYLIVTTNASNEGDSCIKDGEAGTCMNIKNCPTAIDDVRNRNNPKLCTFNGSDPIVCCIGSPDKHPDATLPPMKIESTKKEQCDRIPLVLTSTKTGQKAWDKCIDYQEQLVFPCDKTSTLTGELMRSNGCVHNSEELIVGDIAYRGQFPHMVLLGYGNDSASTQWLCSGTLLSDKFILTAGHCAHSREYGQVTFAVVGAFNRSDYLDGSKVNKIRRIIKHPDYKPPLKYNDIALLETETQMKLNKYVIPACLDVGKETTYNRAYATGWNTSPYPQNTDDLQKVTLEKFSEAECSEEFPPTRRIRNGFDSKTHICYGDRHNSKDSCQDDSGGPLQVKNKHVYCMYTVIGVTSFGKPCFSDAPGLYTKVEAYVPWIESIVWP